MFTAYTAGSYSAGIDQMTELWGISEVAAETGITIFTCGFAIAPMVLAPFSEIQGRRPMFVVTGILFVVFQVVCAVTPTFAGMLVARFLVGCAGSSFSTMVGGVVSDIYRAENRNTAMALFAGAALVGTGLGPLVSGFIAYNTTWRWIFYLQVIVDGVVIVFIVFFFKETRGSVLLSRKAKALNK
ncbi:MFS general substrate transporter, partial [Hortaea werneckii]